MAPAPTGNDETGNGTKDNPFATLERCSKAISGAYNYTELVGDTIILLAGVYPHETTFIGFDSYFRGKDEEHRLVVMGDPEIVSQGEKPVYDGGFDSEFGAALSINFRYNKEDRNDPEDDVQHLIIQDIIFRNFYYYGINLADGGQYSRLTPAFDIIIDNCEFHTGIGHIRHGLKLSGVDDFEVKNCLFTGIRYNCIDGVGLHDGHIHDNVFRDCQTGPDEGNGVMCKGGSRNVLIEKNIFMNLNCYGVQIGQTTDASLTRPPYGTPDAEGNVMDYEAKDIDVFRNIFIHVAMPIKWDCARGGRVYQNTFYTPNNTGELYGANRMFKIAQIHETWDGTFTIVQCQGGEFFNNVVYYGKTNGYPSNRVVWVQHPETQPETFVFSNNLWYCHADPSKSMPDWSTLESLYGCPQHEIDIIGDPMFVDSNPTEPTDFIVSGFSPARGVGAILQDVQYDFLDKRFAVPPTLGALEVPSSGAPPTAPNSVRIWPSQIVTFEQKKNQ